MSNGSSVDKDRLYFTQFNGDFKVRCPLCVKIKKILSQCKKYRNFHAAWCHVKRDHHDITPAEEEEIISIFSTLYDFIKRGIIPSCSYHPEPETTTSSSILIEGHKPRKDQLRKLIKIGKVLKTQSEFFPKFREDKLQIFIKIATLVYDKRTLTQYFDCVTKYSKKDNVKGEYDVSGFCAILGL